ncbi:hypothetical protein ACJJTC_016595 [Scirpophaga incertulas]
MGEDGGGRGRIVVREGVWVEGEVPGGGVAELWGVCGGWSQCLQEGFPETYQETPNSGYQHLIAEVLRGGGWGQLEMQSRQGGLWGVGVMSPGGAPLDLSGHPKHGVSTPDRSGVGSGWSGVVWSPRVEGLGVWGGNLGGVKKHPFFPRSTVCGDCSGARCVASPEGCCEEQLAGLQLVGAEPCGVQRIPRACLCSPLLFQTQPLDASTSTIGLHV